MVPYWNLGKEEDEKAASFAWLLALDVVKGEVLRGVVDLKVLEIIRDHGPGACVSAAKIVAKLPTTRNMAVAATALGHMLDVLVSNSILTLSVDSGEERYGFAPVCKFFMPNEDGVSWASFIDAPMHNCMVDGLQHIKYEVLEDSLWITKAWGIPFYKYLVKHPVLQRSYSMAMSDHSTLVMREILKTYRGFEGLSSVVDVGGNTGATLALICSQYPIIKGINFDVAHVIADAPSHLGVEHVVGNMFVDIPKGDAIFLKWILNTMTDDECLKILTNCYSALPEDHGKVIVCEYLLPDESTTNIAAISILQFNALTMCMHNCTERTETKNEELAFKAGFFNPFDLFAVHIMLISWSSSRQFRPLDSVRLMSK